MLSTEKTFQYPLIRLFICFMLLFSTEQITQAQSIEFEELPNFPSDKLKMVNDVLIDSKGYLWIAHSGTGLLKFDGYSFKEYYNNPNDSTSIVGTSCVTIAEDNAGNIWAGVYSNGISKLSPKTEKFTHFVENPLDSNSLISSLIDQSIITEDSLYWIATQMGLSKINLNSNNLTNFQLGSTSNLMIDNNNKLVSMVYVQKDQLTYEFKIAFWDEDNSEMKLIDIPNIKKSRVLNGYIDSNNTLWIGYNDGLRSYSFIRDKASNEISLTPIKEDYISGHIVIKQTPKDKEHLWVWTDKGIGILNKKTGDFNIVLDKSESGSGSGSVFEKSMEGQLIAFSKGTIIRTKLESHFKLKSPSVEWLHCGIRYNDSLLLQGAIGFHLYNINQKKYESLNDFLPSLKDTKKIAFDIKKGKDGLIYFIEMDFAYKSKLFKFDPNSNTLIEKQYGIPPLTEIAIDKDDNIWLGGWEGFYKVDGTNLELIKTYTVNKDSISLGPSSNSIRRIMMDHEGIIWLGTQSNGLNRFDPKTERFEHFVFDNQDLTSISNNTVTSICEDSQKRIWVGTASGLNVFDRKSKQFKRILKEDGLNVDFVFALTESKGYIWAGTEEILNRIDPNTYAIKPFVLEDDGNCARLRKFVEMDDGSLHYGPFDFYPDSIGLDTIVPPIYINDLIFNDKNLGCYELGLIDQTIPYTKEVNLTHDQNAFTITYVAPNFVKPNTMRYSTYLEGFDKDWQLSNTKREVSYTNIPSGEYNFKVKVINEDGFESKQPANLKISIAPPWYWTWWSKSLYFLFTIGTIYAFYRIQLHRQLAEKEAIRLKDVEKEKARSEKLLLNILPYEVAEELKNKGRVAPKDFNDVSIIFSDFKGFTEAAALMNAQELVGEISACFKAFDNLMEKYEIEKIKTIGDAYMAASGLSAFPEDAVKKAVLAALDMQEFMKKRKESLSGERDRTFEMRIGVHTGPVVAGVVGVKKFQYDLWGDTVNIASRMESNGSVEKVNISESSYALLKDDPDFKFYSRGDIMVKGKGQMSMYFVEHANS